MRAQAKGTIPDLPDGLGTQIGTNGDRIFTWANITENTGACRAGRPASGSGTGPTRARPHTVVHGPIPIPVESHLMTVIGFGVTPVRGAFHYDTTTDDSC